jgi:type I restriction enzyme S subunit
MSSEWKTRTFGDLVDFVSLKAQANEVHPATYVSTENMLPDFGGIQTAASVPRSGGVTKFSINDVLFSNIRTYFKKVWKADFNGHCSNDVLVFRPKDSRVLLPGYLHNLCRWDEFTEFSVRTSKGAKMPRGDKDALVQFQCQLPPIEIQRAIDEIFSGLDDRITLLRETNTTLEAIAQALFKSWFVDFDPVHAKMQGRVPEGMDQATAALFPDSFDESELGAVPKGWHVKSLDAVASFLNGLALQKFPPTGDNDLPVIKIAQLRKGDTVGADLASRSIKPEYVIQNGDVLFSWSGSLEVEIWCGGEGALNQHLFKVTSDVFPKWFYFLWTRHHLDHFRQVAASKATTMGHIQRAHLTGAKALVPSDGVLRAANSVLEPIIQRLIENSLQANSLAALRDTLLPRLISGQLRLSELELISNAEALSE